ncbi:MAG: amino acid ABC transporter substrate-binding protein [Gemmatimonadales bacterium]|nr:MAG: amino acid ABC transporter substrate-binding protein [Gemmatimonadales bacterium]
MNRSGMWLGRALTLLLMAPVALALTGCEDPDDMDRLSPAGEPAAEGQAAVPNGIDPLSAPTFAEARDAGEAEIQVLYVASGGFAGTDEDGRLTGVTVELLREFGRFLEAEYGIAATVRFQEEGHWPTFYQRVRYSEGGVFGIGNVTITEPRRGELNFSPPYLDNVAILMTHEDVPELEAMEEISEAFGELTGLMYTGTLHEVRMEDVRDRHFPDMPTMTISTNDQLVGAVASGDGYFGYIDVYNYWRAVEEGAPLRRHAVGDDASEQFGVIMPHSSDWSEPMEAFFQRDGGLTDSEWYRELMREHLGEALAGLLQGDDA